MKKAIFILTLILLIASARISFAQGEWLDAPVGIRPDSPLYLVERLKERLTLFFTFGEKAKAEKLFRFAEERLAEAEAMATHKKPEVAEKVLKRYEEQLEQAEKHLAKAEEKGEKVEELKEKITENALRHQAILQSVYERVPEEAKEAVAKAMEVSQRGYEKSSEAVAKDKRLQILKKVDQRIEGYKQRVPKSFLRLIPGLKEATETPAAFPMLELEEEAAPTPWSEEE